MLQPVVVAGGREESSGAQTPREVGMKTDRIRTDITDIIFVFIFMSGFRFEYG
jgi:hypothetical protein